jgi:hypothetical protein
MPQKLRLCHREVTHDPSHADLDLGVQGNLANDEGRCEIFSKQANSPEREDDRTTKLNAGNPIGASEEDDMRRRWAGRATTTNKRRPEG